MKGFKFIIFFTIVFTTLLVSNTITNGNTPKKGDWDFQIKEIWKADSFGEKLLAMVQNVAVHEDGRIFVFDRTHFKFFVLNSNGKLLKSFGKRGEGPGEMKYMLNFYLLQDKIIVYDMGKIHYYGLEGNHLKSVPTNTTIGIAPNLFLDENRLLKIRRSFGMGPAGAKPEALEIVDTSTGKLTYVDGGPKAPNVKKPGGVMVMLSIGSGQYERSTSYVTGMQGKDLMWGMNDTYLIHLCDSRGKKNLSFSVEGRKQKPISQAYKEQMVARMRFRTDGGGPSEKDIKKRYMKSIPDQCTYYSQVVSGNDGLIYVYTSDVGLTNGQEIDIFSDKGEYLYKSKIALPEGNIIQANGLIFKGDFLYMVIENDEGDLSLRKYTCSFPSVE